MNKPVYRFDSGSRIHWLEFDGKPEQAIIDLLKHNNWRWSGYRKQWRNNGRFTKVPTGIDYEDGGECDYAQERPDRLRAAAGRAEERSEQAYEQSNALVENLSSVQAVVHGTRAGRQQEKVLERSRRQQEISEKEQKKAGWLERKARSSARHQQYKERPDVIARRIKRLKSSITSIRNSMQHEPYGLWSARKEGNQAKVAELLAAWAEDNRVQEDKIRTIEAEIAENEQALQEAGGLIADREVIEVGDVIKAGWRGLCQVQKINKRNGEIMSYTCGPLENTWCSKYVVPKDEVYGVELKKDQVTSEAVLEAGMHARAERTYQASVEPEKREFAIEKVEVVEIYNTQTSLFPTPVALADQLASYIPRDAYLILEPSAGTGNLADAVTRLLMERGQNHRTHCCEILPQLRRSLIERGYQVVGEDFTKYMPDFLYDAIIGNPPFKGTEWLDHVEHMLELLKPGGTLAVIVAAGFAFREDKRIKAFREMVEECGWWEHLPEESFVESGTAVRTVMLVMQKPEEQKWEPEPIEPLGEIQALSLW